MAKKTEDPASICKPMVECAERFEKNGCADFIINEETRSKVANCSKEELNKPVIKDMEGLFAACGIGVQKEAIGIWAGIKKLPSKMVHGLDEQAKIIFAAQKYCTDLLKLPEAPIFEDRMTPIKTTKDWDKCVSRKSSEGQELHLPSMEKIKGSVHEIFQASQCFKAESMIEMMRLITAIFGFATIGVIVGLSLVGSMLSEMSDVVLPSASVATA